MANKNTLLVYSILLIILISVVHTNGQRQPQNSNSGFSDDILRILSTPHEPLDYLLERMIGPPLSRGRRPMHARPPPRHRQHHNPPVRRRPLPPFFKKFDDITRESRDVHVSCEKGHRHGGLKTHFNKVEDSFKNSNTHFTYGKEEHSFNTHSSKDEDSTYAGNVKPFSGLKNSDVILPFKIDGMNFDEFLKHGFQHSKQPLAVADGNTFHELNSEYKDYSNIFPNNLKQDSFIPLQSNIKNKPKYNPDDYKNHHVEEVLRTIPFKYRLPLESEIPSDFKSNDYVDHFPSGHSVVQDLTSQNQLHSFSDFELDDSEELVRFQLPLKPINTIGNAFDGIPVQLSFGDSTFKHLSANQINDANRFFRSVKPPNQKPKESPITNVGSTIRLNLDGRGITNFGPILLATEPFKGSIPIEVTDLHKLVSGIVDENGKIRNFKNWEDWILSNERKKILQILGKTDKIEIPNISKSKTFTTKDHFKPQTLKSSNNLRPHISSNSGSIKLPSITSNNHFGRNSVSNNEPQFPIGNTNSQSFHKDITFVQSTKDVRPTLLISASNNRGTINSETLFERENDFTKDSSNIDTRFRQNFLKSDDLSKPQLFIKETSDKKGLQLFGEDNILGALELVMEAVSSTDNDETLYLVRTNDGDGDRKKRKTAQFIETSKSSYTSYENKPIIEIDLRNINGDGEHLESSSYSKLKRRVGE